MVFYQLIIRKVQREGGGQGSSAERKEPQNEYSVPLIGKSFLIAVLHSFFVEKAA